MVHTENKQSKAENIEIMHNIMISSGRSRRSIRRLSLINLSLIIISCLGESSLSFLISPQRATVHQRPHTYTRRSTSCSSGVSSLISPQQTTFHQRHPTLYTRRSTTLHVSWFDKFHLPYGVNTTTNFNNDEVELLEALLPELPTPEDKRRVMEGFQQARLSEQLRLSKNKRGVNEQPKFLADDENEVSRMADLFQQARLSEQLRLSKIKGVYPSGDEGMNIEDDIMSDEDFDKVEMFQRALLEEQLKIRRLQRQKRKEQHRLVVSRSESIEKAMNEYEVEHEKEMHQMVTMVRENETAGEDEIDDGTNDDIDAAEIILANLSTNDNNDGNSKASEGKLSSLNQTEPSHQLDIQLAKLHQMIAFTTSSPGLDTNVATKSDTTTNGAKVSLQTFLSTTYLPLQPREDASILSLALAPVAHLLSSVFLFGTSIFYAVLAVLDVMMNDTDTRAYLKETGRVLKCCFTYVFPRSRMKVQEGVTKRTFKAFQTSFVASFYALQCVCVCAARRSKYRQECGDAATGALRYLVYALRSVKVIWHRMTNNMKRSFQECKVQSMDSPSKPSLTLANDTPGKRIHRVYSDIKGKFSGKKEGMEYQQDIQPNELYEQKLRLNQDRIELERDKLQLQEGQRLLELEKGKLLADGLNIMAWYAAVEDKIGEQSNKVEGEKKKRWWRRN